MKRKRDSDMMEHSPRSPYPNARTTSPNIPSSLRTSSDSSAHWDGPPRIEISEVDSIHSVPGEHESAHSPPQKQAQQPYTQTSADIHRNCTHPPQYSETEREDGGEDMEVDPTGNVPGEESLDTSEREQRLRKRDYAKQMTRIMGRQLVSGISRTSKRDAGL